MLCAYEPAQNENTNPGCHIILFIYPKNLRRFLFLLVWMSSLDDLPLCDEHITYTITMTFNPFVAYLKDESSRHFHSSCPLRQKCQKGGFCRGFPQPIVLCTHTVSNKIRICLYYIYIYRSSMSYEWTCLTTYINIDMMLSLIHPLCLLFVH